MRYKIHYEPSQCTIYLTLIGEVTTDDVFHYNLEIEQILQQSRQKLHLLIDASKLTRFPSNLQTMRRLMTSLGHPNLGAIVDWGNHVTNFYFINSVLNQLAHKPHYSATSKAQASERLHLISQTITFHLQSV